MDEAEGLVRAGRHDPFMKNLLNIWLISLNLNTVVLDLFVSYVWMISGIFYPNFDGFRRVCMNFVGSVGMRFEMYAGSVFWPGPTSLFVEWSPVRGRMQNFFYGSALEISLSLFKNSSD